jgi:hypothetical protein
MLHQIQMDGRLSCEMAPQWIHWQAGSPMLPAHLNLSDAGWQYQIRCHLGPKRHLCLDSHPCHPVSMVELDVSKSSMCWLDICIHMHILPVLNDLLLIHMPRIANKINILIQICWLMKEHPLVSTLSAVW